MRVLIVKPREIKSNSISSTPISANISFVEAKVLSRLIAKTMKLTCLLEIKFLITSTITLVRLYQVSWLPTTLAGEARTKAGKAYYKIFNSPIAVLYHENAW